MAGHMDEKSVFVGVDGSPGSGAALEYAMREATLRQLPLRVVAAVALPEVWGGAYPAAYIPPPPREFVGEVRREMQGFVDHVAAAGGGVGELRISVQARAGRPGEVLVTAADGAELLVVGHRGRGSVASLFLGSVGLYCVLHARCPVTVVRPRTEPVSASASTAVGAAAPA